jgi:hypothetical protein
MEEESTPAEIQPKKLPKPWKSSAERRDLHRELVFNHKTGKQVIGQKTELQRVLESKKISKSRIDRGEQNNNTNKSHAINNGGGGDEDADIPEFLRIHNKILHK